MINDEPLLIGDYCDTRRSNHQNRAVSVVSRLPGRKDKTVMSETELYRVHPH